MKLGTKLTLVLLLVFNCFGFLTAQEEINKRELIALLELRAKTHGNQWTNAWDLETSVSEWYGVKVKNGKVVALDLADNNLKGNLPLTVGNLTNLEYLDLSNNELSGRMPRELRKFGNLKYLDLSGNKLVGTLPMTLNRMTDLVYLDLGGNGFDGELPKSLTELTNLNSLALADNNFSGEMPEGMENLKKLEKLFISKNNFDSLDGLRLLSRQQLVLVDVDVNVDNFNTFDFSKTQEGTAELKFEDDH